MFSFPENQCVEKVYREDGKVKREIREDNKLISKATAEDIQGFPPNAQTKSIYEIVGEIRREEQERERRRMLKEKRQREDQAEKEIQRKKLVPSVKEDFRKSMI